MKHISIKVTDDLYKAVTRKSKELGNIKLSDTVRTLLRSALESNNQPEDKTYKLLELFIKLGVKNGETILQEAEKLNR